MYKIEIDKITYPKWQPRTTYDVHKNKQLQWVYCILKCNSINNRNDFFDLTCYK